MRWWKRRKQRPGAEDLQREIQATRVRLAQVEAEIRRYAAEQETRPTEPLTAWTGDAA